MSKVQRKVKKLQVIIMAMVMMVTLISVPPKSVKAAESSTNASGSAVTATITEREDNQWWYEYTVVVNNRSSKSICNWQIKAYLPNANISDLQSWGACTVTYSNNYVYIKGMGDGNVITAGGNNSAYNVKFGLGHKLGLDTSDIVEITFEYGTEANVGTSDQKCNYTLTGETKNLAYSKTPVGMHGKLHVDGIFLYDQNNKKVQLRGASLHGIQWDVGYNYINKGSFQSLRDEWGINAVRLPVYVTQNGYTEGSQAVMDTRIQSAVNIATDLGMYVIIDWHVHSASGETTNPNTWKSQAQAFFEKYSGMYKNNNNVLFEICNEPVNTKWYDGSGNDIYSYANTIIPIIRKNTDAVVIVGTNTWSQDVDDVAGHKLNTTNTMYTIHFYSATHTDNIRSKVQTALDKGVPVFCTEFGVCSADGNGSYNLDEADKWMDLFDKYSISYFCWQLSNKSEKASYLATGCTKTNGGWTNSDLSTTGIWLINENRPKADAEIDSTPVWTTQTAPAAPTKKSATTNTIVLNTIAGCEYSKDGKNWQTSTTFAGLSANTEYTFYARKAEDAANYLKASPASAGTKIKTSPILVTGVTLDKTTLVLEDIGNTHTFTATVTPNNASNKSLTWTSANSAVASVSNGKVTAKSTGTTKITVKANDGSGKTATCTVTVYETPDAPAATDAVVNKYTTDTITLNYIQGCEYSKDGVNWQDSNVFTGLEPGKEYTFYVRVKGDDKYVKDGAYTTVKASTLKQDEKVVPVTGIAFDNKLSSSCKLAIGEAPSWTFKASVTPADATQKGVIYSTSNDRVLTIDGNGVVKAVGPGKATITAASVEGGYSDTIDIEIYKPFVAPEIDVFYRTHIQNVGWEGTESNIKTWKKDGAMSGTSGRALRLEGINIVVTPETTCPELDLGIQYTTHCQDYGWLPWSADGDMNGTEGESKRLEAIEIQLTGEHKDLYDVYYRVHAQDYGWLGWAKNGEPSGTAGKSKRLEGIQIQVVKKGTTPKWNADGITSDYSGAFYAAPGSSPIVNYPSTSNQYPVIPGSDKPNVVYKTHVQNDGWQCWKYNGQMSGTSGEAKRLEGIEINVTNKDYEGGIAYCTHVQTYGWQGADLDKPSTWKQDGDMAGTFGEAKRLEAICITLTGEMAEHYDIYYRVHAQSYGWLGWASNGAPSGTAGYAKRLEGIQIVIVPKGGGAPANTYMGVTSKNPQAYIEK